jgi:MFS family permease
MRRVSVALFGVNVLVQAAAVLLLGVLQRDVLADDVAGFAAGAFVIGAVGAAVVLNAYAYQPARWAALALGYLAGGAALLVVGGMPATALLLLVALVVAGIALASVTPSAAMVVAERVPAALRGRASGLVASTAFLGIPLGTLAGAWVLPRTGIVLAITLASALYLVVTLVPLLILSAWREVMPEQPPPGTPSRSAEKLRARMSVTLAYADGQWLVEVRKGRALLGSRHAINAADALRTLALLDVPTVYHGIGRVLSTDQDEAARQVQRARNELAELEARLSGLQEMVDLSDNNKPT